MDKLGKYGNLITETDLQNDELLNSYSDEANDLNKETTAIKYTGLTSIAGIKVHELLFLAGILVLGGYLLKRYYKG